MSRLARRTLRATAAVAGIAAAGVGIAAPAFAAPAAPERPSTDEAAPAPAPDTRATPNLIGSAPKAPDQLSDLPQLFTIQGTTVHTADRGLPQLPVGGDLPTQALPQPDDTVNTGDTQPTRGTDINFRTAAPQQDSAMQRLDAASMFGALPGQVLGSTANNDIRS
jgi:hypothetical protein